MKRTDGQGDVSQAALQRARTRMAMSRTGSASPTNTESPVAITGRTVKSEHREPRKETTAAIPPLQDERDRPTKKKSDPIVSTRGPSLSTFARSTGSRSSRNLSSSHPSRSSHGGNFTPSGPIAEHGSLAALSSLRSGASSSGALSRDPSLINDNTKEDFITSTIQSANLLSGRIGRRSMNPALAKIVSQDAFIINSVAPDVVLRQRELVKKRTLDKEAGRELWRQSLGTSSDGKSPKDGLKTKQDAGTFPPKS